MFGLLLCFIFTWESIDIEALSKKTAGNLTKVRAAYFFANVRMHFVLR